MRDRDVRDELRRRSRARGLALGLALGDTMGGLRRSLPEARSLRCGVSTQLAAFTLEGAIRAMVRADHKGICHPPSVVWHAYCRWAALQGIEREAMNAQWGGHMASSWPDGWLARVPALAQRRGSAPATVAALQQFEAGTVEQPTTRSAGCHALTRTLPLAALALHMDAAFVTGFARDVAALTHGDAKAQAATAVGVHLAAQCFTADTLDAAVNATFSGGDLDYATGIFMAVDWAQNAAAKMSRKARLLAELAPDATAVSALRGGIYAALSYPERDDVMDALRFAAGAPNGASVAAVTGALLGAFHGVEVWPVELLSRLELAWALDTLARDLVTQMSDHPAGQGYQEPSDPHWWDRYPGW